MEASLSYEYLEKGMITLEHIISDDGVIISLPGKVLTKRMLEIIAMHDINTLKVNFDPLKHPRAAEYCGYKRDKHDKRMLMPVNPVDVEPLIDGGLRDEALMSIKKIFAAFDSLEDVGKGMTTAHLVIKEVDEVVDKLIDTLSDDNYSLIHIEGLRAHDEYTYHHSLSVAVLSIAIGQCMSFSDEELKLLGRAAMLHDLGKINTPNELINKPGKLTDDEFKKIKNHPSDGYRYLMMEKIGDENLRKIIVSHHEKMDGTGYPNRLLGDEIPFMSRIIAVADVYDAVTSYRSYRKPMSPTDAIELIMSQVGRHFDYTVVRTFVDKIDFYPINTCIELNNGRTGVVIDNTNTMRPVLRMLDNDEVLDLLGLNNLNLAIIRVVENDEKEG